MMKKIPLLSTLLLFASLAVFTQVAQAEIHNNGATDNEDIAPLETDSARSEGIDSQRGAAPGREGQFQDSFEVKEKIREVRDRIERRRQEINARVNARVLERIQMALDITLTRFEEAIIRRSNIADRLESRLDRMESRSIDVTETREILESARKQLMQAAESISDIADSTQDIITADTPREIVGEAKAAINTAREELRGAHETLVEALASARADYRQFSEAETRTNQDED